MPALTNSASLLRFLPEMCLGGGALVVLLADLLRPSRKLAAGLSLLALAAAAVALPLTATRPTLLFHGLVARDGFADFFKVVFLGALAVTAVLALLSREALERSDHESGELFALLLGVGVGLFLMAGASDLLIAYLGLETASILAFVLVGWKRRDRGSSEAALKYAIYGGVASGVMLYGLSWIYGLCGSTSFETIRLVAAREPVALVVAVALALAGFGYKIAAVPFHMWCPDAYEGAPTPITAFLSVGPKAAGFALLIRFFGAVPDSGELGKTWFYVLGALAAATMTLGNFAAISQRNVKRLLAYSSIAHAGYLLLGLAVLTPSGSQAMLFYLVAYLFMNLGAFAVVIAVAEHGLGETIESYRGLGFRAPLLGATMAIFLFSLVGLPPTAGFAGKFLLFAAVIEKGGPVALSLALIAVVNSAISLYYYARILRAMYFDRPSGDELVVGRAPGALVTVLAVPVLVLGVFWGPLQSWASRATMILGR